MRADELMIGNWALYAGEEERLKNKPIRVTGIGPDYMQGSFWNGVSDEVVVLSYKEIKPIPIDVDILEANGWRKKQERLYDLEGRLIEKSGTTWYMYVSEKAMLRYDPISIMYYVHELQNLLRVTNYGKAEIKL